jgi:hypothetical protein
VDPEWSTTLPGSHFFAWQHQSFLWRNPGHRSFDDYLALFKSTQRRNIRRERQSITRQGITLRCLHGDEIDPGWAGPMFQYYLNTNAQYGPWAARYLNAAFFRGLFEQLRHRLMVVAAFTPAEPAHPAALSLLLRKGGELIGRYWGSAQAVKDLHFNLCFYEPIQWAIGQGLRTFDPGAGSPHKIARGFEAVINTSLHRFYPPVLKALFGRFIDGINAVELANIAALNARLPFAAGQ